MGQPTTVRSESSHAAVGRGVSAVGDAEPPTLAPAPASPWGDGFGRLAIRSGQALLVLGLTALLVAVMVQLRLVVVPILISILLAAAINPLVGILHRRGLPRFVAVWLALLTGFLAIGGVAWVVVAGVRDQWSELSDRASDGLAQFEEFLSSAPLGIDASQLDKARTALLELLQGEEVRTGAIAGATAAAEVVAGTFLGVIILFFLLKDGGRIWEFVLRPVPASRRQRMLLVGNRSVEVLGGYVRGTAIVALVDALIIGTALAVLRVPLALPLALVVFIGAFIPLVGATIAGILAALVALVANGPVTALIVLGIVIAVNQIEGDVLAPLVLGRAVSLHPLAILLALTVGTILAGVTGALLSVPLAAVAWTAVTTWNDDKNTTAAAPLATDSPPTIGARPIGSD